MTSVVRLVFSMAGEVCRVMEKDAERHERLYGGLQNIMAEMQLVEAMIKVKEPRGAIQEIKIRQLQDLAYDIEDFVEGLWEPGKYGRVLVALGADPRLQQLERIDRFEKKITSLIKEWKEIAESSEGQDTDVVDAISTLHEDSNAKLEGIDEPKRKILELLSPSSAEGQLLRVVSIVGCHGVGKTALARAVYKDCLPASDEFDCVAWVTASGCDNRKALLDKILESVRVDLERRRDKEKNVTKEAEAALTTNLQDILLNKRMDKENVTMEAESALTRNLHDILLNKRCLVFIDDVQQVQAWKETVDECPLDGSKSRIIVTTTVRSVATACSSGSYVYSMQCLNNVDSKTLFWRNVYGYQKDPSFSMETASQSIFRKCGGLPLALTTVSKYLYLKGNGLRSGHCEDVGQNLGKDYLFGNNNNATMSVFKGMRRVLRQCYDNLPDYDHRFILLYLSIFPQGYHINRNSLVRRLKAEGLVVNERCKYFDELIDRCIIEPVQIFNNSIVVKSCQVHDLVLEYIIQKSIDKNVVTLIQGPEPQLIGQTGACVRRLSVQSSTIKRFHELEDRSTALRSLSLFNSQPIDLQKCMNLRLLDLEGCTGLDNTFLQGLCELLLLRYLNLRNTGIRELPPHIEKLQCLETLDIRDTKVEKLPMEIIMLPKLAYLFGKFQLPDAPDRQSEKNKLSDFLENKSVLHTLAGFVANKRHGPEHVILLARKLKKVKVWCNDTTADTRSSFPVPDQSSSRSQGRIMSRRRRTECSRRCNNAEGSRSENFDFISLLKERSKTLESVSVVSSGLCEDFLCSLEGPCTISSIKLRGNLGSLPDSDMLSQLGRIKKLQLFSTGLSIKELSVLQYLRGLEYLKLVEHDTDTFCQGIFIVEKKGFESLMRLCIDAPMVPEMQFKGGAMASLTTLQLLCPNSKMQPSETIKGISHLTSLTEVILHSSLQKAWETVANENPNRPSVNRQPE